MSDFVLIAHRGFSSKAPENTFAAFNKAIEAGFTNIELDVQLSSDGVPVIIHDDTLDRTTNGQGRVAQTSLGDLKTLDAGSWFNKSFVDERIPTLVEVLELYYNQAHLHIELKSEDPDLPYQVFEAITKTGWNYWDKTKTFIVPGITITSFHLDQLEKSIKSLPSLPHHWLMDPVIIPNVERALQTRITGICSFASKANREDVTFLHNNNLTTRGWGVQNNSDLKLLFESGSEGATVDWPDQAAAFLQKLQ